MLGYKPRGEARNLRSKASGANVISRFTIPLGTLDTAKIIRNLATASGQGAQPGGTLCTRTLVLQVKGLLP